MHKILLRVYGWARDWPRRGSQMVHMYSKFFIKFFFALLLLLQHRTDGIIFIYFFRWICVHNTWSLFYAIPVCSCIGRPFGATVRAQRISTWELRIFIFLVDSFFNIITFRVVLFFSSFFFFLNSIMQIWGFIFQQEWLWSWAVTCRAASGMCYWVLDERDTNVWAMAVQTFVEIAKKNKKINK